MTRYANVPTAAIQANTANVRRDVGDVTELADSIRENGIIEPLVLAPVAAGKSTGTCPDCAGRIALTNDLLLEHVTDDEQVCPGGGRWPSDLYVLIAGHRRHAAATAAGLPEVPAIIRDDLTKVDRQIVTMLGENGFRTDLSPVEEAAAYEQLKLLGYKPAQIAKETGRAKATVDRRLSLLKLPEEMREKVHTHQFTLGDAEALVEFADEPDTLAEIEQHADSPHNFRWALQRARQAREDAAAAKKAREQLVRDGVTILPRPQHWPWGSSDVVPLGRLGLSVEQHASCPHHVAVEPRDSGVEWACTKPAVHAPQQAQPNTTPAVPDPRAGEHQQLLDDLKIAAGLRREFLTHYLRDVRPTPEHQVVIVGAGLRHILDEVWFPNDDWLRWLGEEPADGVDIDERIAQLLDQATTGGDPGAAVKPLLAAAAAAYEGGPLLQPFGWQPGREAVAWLPTLIALGYEASDVEDRLLEEATARRCRLCQCTDDEACEGGCAWVDDPAGKGDICSRCEADAAAEVEASA